MKLSKLDTFINNNPPPDFIKIDIEGAEYMALLGATVLLERYNPIILLSTHGSEVHNNSTQLLKFYGYKLNSINVKTVEETDLIFAVKK